MRRKYDLLNKTKPKWAERLVLQFIGGSLSSLTENARKASPFHLATKNTPPVLFIASKNDRSVPFQYSKDTYLKLRRLGVVTKLLLHDSDFHGDVDPKEVEERGWEDTWNKDHPPKLMFHKDILLFLNQILDD